jgi:hypothetical protein
MLHHGDHPKLKELWAQAYEGNEDHPGWLECTRQTYRQQLANAIGAAVNAPNHVSHHFPTDRLEKAWLILQGIEQ